MDFLEQLGSLALASRIRRLLSRLLAQGEQVYRSQQVDFAVSWFPIFHLLANRSPMTITEIANELGMAHPSVIESTDEMIKKGFVGSKRSTEDRRRRNLYLTDKGGKKLAELEPVWKAFKLSGDEICAESGNNFMESIEKLERALDRLSMYERVTARLNKRKS